MSAAGADTDGSALGTSLAHTVVVDWWQHLRAGEVDVTVDHLAPGAILDDPRAGTVAEPDAVRAVLDATARWLADHAVTIDPVAALTDARRTVTESVLAAGRLRLPVAVVADHHSGGLSAVRIYHTLASLDGANRLRPPSLPADPTASAHGAVADYQHALRTGDVAAVVSTYAAAGSFQEPAGPPFVHTGHAALREFFGGLLAYGGIRIASNTVTDDGQRCAVEYTYLGAGPVDLSPQAALQTYTRDPDGLLAATRNYDCLVLPGQ